jgi:transposase InsO family protein
LPAVVVAVVVELPEEVWAVAMPKGFTIATAVPLSPIAPVTSRICMGFFMTPMLRAERVFAVSTT